MSDHPDYKYKPGEKISVAGQNGKILKAEKIDHGGVPVSCYTVLFDGGIEGLMGYADNQINPAITSCPSCGRLLGR